MSLFAFSLLTETIGHEVVTYVDTMREVNAVLEKK
jgi:arginine decarboxylase-like protein